MKPKFWTNWLSILALGSFCVWSAGPYWPVALAVQAMFMLTWLSHHLYFIWLPKRLAMRSKDPAKLRRRLEWIIATPSLMGGQATKILARYLLFCQHQAASRLAEAVTEGHALTSTKLPAGLESEIRQRMADCLERLGRGDEANQQRRLSEACLAGASGSYMDLKSRGKILESKNRHAEAYQAYEQALALVGPSSGPAATVTAIRVEFMLHLVLTSFNAGRPDETVRWAEQAIETGASGEHLLIAHRMAGVAYGNIGDLDRAESHRRRVLELVEPTGDTNAIVKALSQLADIERMRGRLEQADLSCRRAEALGEVSNQLHLVFSEIFRSQGRYEEALGRLRQADASPPLPVPAQQRRIQAIYAKAMAVLEADLRRWPEAHAHLLEAEPTLRPDPKLSLGWEGTMARVLAGMGQNDQAIEHLDQAEARLGDFAEDRTTQAVFLGQAGRAALILGDFERAEHCWTRYLETDPDPVYQPLAHYYRGEALLGLGQVEAAHEAFRQAVALGIDTQHTRHARERLASRAIQPTRPIR